jgi:hypothetical protein
MAFVQCGFDGCCGFLLPIGAARKFVPPATDSAVAADESGQ